jgi:predicted Rossmann fold flavoprotein
MTIEADSVLLATGGRSVMPDLPGPAGFELATVLEHTVRPLFPALVPLVAESAPHRALSGISLEATISVVSGKERTSTSGGFLFTHRGYSGPAVLNVSHAVAQALDAGVAPRVSVAFGDEKTWEERLRGSSGTASALLKRYFPDRLADLFVQTSGIGVKPLQHLPRDDRRRLIATLTDFFLPVTGTEGFRAAEVTGGGVALEEVDPGSGESRLVPGLFLAGEILDVFGPIGGFNFQWAWATGRTAGRAAARAALNAEPLT